jgi:hypothetical protein
MTVPIARSMSSGAGNDDFFQCTRLLDGLWRVLGASNAGKNGGKDTRAEAAALLKSQGSLQHASPP